MYCNDNKYDTTTCSFLKNDVHTQHIMYVCSFKFQSSIINHHPNRKNPRRASDSSPRPCARCPHSSTNYFDSCRAPQIPPFCSPPLRKCFRPTHPRPPFARRRGCLAPTTTCAAASPLHASSPTSPEARPADAPALGAPFRGAALFRHRVEFVFFLSFRAEALTLPPPVSR